MKKNNKHFFSSIGLKIRSKNLTRKYDPHFSLNVLRIRVLLKVLREGSDSEIEYLLDRIDHGY